MLQLSQDIFRNAVFVKFGLDSSNDLVNDSAIDTRLNKSKESRNSG